MRLVVSVAVTTAIVLAVSSPAIAEQSVSARPGSAFRDCPDCPEMVAIPAGTFTMGSPESEEKRDKHEGPQHTVTLPRPFAVSKFEVTIGQFRQFVRETGYTAARECVVWTGSKGEKVQGKSWQDPNFSQNENHPVVCITWEDAKAYIAWLAGKTGKAYRFLSETEWEFAARAGSTTTYAFGGSEDDLCKYGNVADLTANSGSKAGTTSLVVANCRDGYGYATAPVGSFPPNKFGLYDMVGNAWEMVEDCYHDSYSEAPTDGSAWITGECKYRVTRGGGWGNAPRSYRPAHRDRDAPVDHGGTLGFRLARTL